MSSSEIDWYAIALPSMLSDLLKAERPDTRTWALICDILDAEMLSRQHLDAVKKALSSWPREVPRRQPKEWQRSAGMTGSAPLLRHHAALSALCLDVAENEQLYNYYVAQVAASPRLRLRDGSPAVSLWRQMRGRVQLQNGTSLALGEGQPGLADLGGVMTVEVREGQGCACGNAEPCSGLRCTRCRYVADAPIRLSLYVEAEIKICGKLPPGCREYRGTSTRQLSDTERDQVQRQKAQLTRGGCYVFCERVEELVDGFVAFRDDVVARLS